MRALKTILFATTTLLSGFATMVYAADLAPEPTHQQMVEMEGNYARADGRHARLLVMDNRLFMDIGRHYKELEPAGPDQWTTRDRSITLLYKRGEAADEIVLDYRKDLPDAAPIRLAARDQRGRGAID